MMTKYFHIGAFLQPGMTAFLASADTVLPWNNPNTSPKLNLVVTGTFLAGDLAAVDCGEYHGVGPAPTVQSGFALRLITDQERELLATRGIG